MSELIHIGVRTRISRRTGFSPLLLPVLAALCAGLGLVAVEGPLWFSVALASIPLGALALAATVGGVAKLGSGALPFAVIWVLLVVSTFVWRGRTTQQLESTPLDTAGVIRVGLVAVVGFLVLALATKTSTVTEGLFDGAVKFLALYLVVGSIAALGSPLPMQALYRVLELAVGLGAILLARMWFGIRAGEILTRIAIGTTGFLLVVVWIEAFAMPSRAWQNAYFHAYVPYVLSGPVPSFTSNTVGTFGALLAVWGLATVKYRGTGLAWLFLLSGITTVAATQYRTGVAALIIAGVVVACLRRRFLAAGVLVLTMVLIVSLFGAGHFVLQESTSAFAKGQPTEQLQSLNSRTSYWEPAWALTKERPLFGWGLNVGSRRAIVSSGDNSTSTAHNTWVEAMVGTGFVGLLVLALGAATALTQSLRSRSNPRAIAVTGLIVVLLVRTATGTTFELFSIYYLLFAALAVAANDMFKSSPSARRFHGM